MFPGDITTPVSIQLLETEASRKDVTVATYEAEGEIKTGTFWKRKNALPEFIAVSKREESNAAYLG